MCGLTRGMCVIFYIENNSLIGLEVQLYLFSFSLELISSVKLFSQEADKTKKSKRSQYRDLISV